MEQIKLHEQLVRLRKKKGWSQETLAQAVGVTNQSVSKWESGQCCPDIQLLPELARLLDISVDELLGRGTEENLAGLCRKVRRFFREIPEGEAFDAGFRLAELLHEGMLSGGYRRYLPWGTEKDFADGDKKWGVSISHEPEGSTLHIGNGILFRDGEPSCHIGPAEIFRLQTMGRWLCDGATVKVFFALQEVSLQGENFVPAEDIAETANLPVERIKEILEKIPVQVSTDEEGRSVYRLKNEALHLPELWRWMAVEISSAGK